MSSNGMRSMASQRQRWWLAAGPLTYLACYLLALASGATFDYRRNGMWQFVNAQQPPGAGLTDLWYLHTQPPGFNALLLTVDRLGEHASAAWQIALLAGTCAAIWMAADMARAWTASIKAGALAGMAAALLPGTTLYSLWLFYTQPVSLLVTAACWAYTRGRTGSSWGYPLSIAAMATLFATRSSFAWPVAGAWIAVTAIQAGRHSPAATRRATQVAAIAGLSLIGLLSARSLLLFDSATQSTWGPENYARALTHSIDPAARQAVANSSPCHGTLLRTGTFQPPDAYPECGPQANAAHLPGSVLLDTGTWADGSTNYSSRQRLALAGQWKDLTLAMLQADPLAALRVPLSNERGAGSLRILLSSSADYSFLAANRAALGPVGNWWVTATGWLPPALLAAWLALLAVASSRRKPLPAGYLPASVLALAMLAVYLLAEIGENERFRVELDPLIVALGFTALTIAARHVPRRRRPARHDICEPGTTDRQHSQACVPVPAPAGPFTSMAKTSARTAYATLASCAVALAASSALSACSTDQTLTLPMPPAAEQTAQGIGPSLEASQEEARQVAQAEQVARQVIGKDEQEAIDMVAAAGLTYRISEKDGEPAGLTMDFAPTRVNLSVANGTVTAATLG